MFPNTAAWNTAFGSGGIAGAYKDYMTNTILPQITTPPTYLTQLWETRIKSGITAAENLPDVKTDSNDNTKQGRFYPEWEKYSNFANEVEAIYKSSGAYEWEYTFTFQWDRNNKRQDEDDELGDGELSCPFPSSSGNPTISGTATSSMPSGTSSSPTTGTSSTVSSTNSTSTGSSTPTITSVSNSGSTSNPTQSFTSTSSTSSNSSTTQPSRTAAPDITIPTPSEEEEPDCVEGYATYTLQAAATAPASASSLKFYIPKADKSRGDWEFKLIPNADEDPKTNVESWSVGAKDTDELASGKGGEDMEIKWKTPDVDDLGTFRTRD